MGDLDHAVMDDTAAEHDLLDDEDALVDGDALVEEISIDGMCGVY